MHKQAVSVTLGLVGQYLSSGSPGGSGEVLIT